MIAESDVRAAYRFILGREPESEAVLSMIAQRNYSLEELRRTFLNSTEFLQSGEGPARRPMPLDWSPLTIETDGSAAEIAFLLRRIESYWRQIAGDEVHAPLVQSGNPQAAAFTESELLFYADGEKYLQDFRFTAERCGISLADHKVCLELGAGVGRGTRWLATVFQNVLAVDISQLRLDISRRAMKHFGLRNVEHHQLAEIDSLSRLPAFDAFYSMVVLQHNPPPVIVRMLRMILTKLSVGGIAFFQIPTFMRYYTFSVKDYLERPLQANDMEMHPLPQHVLFKLIEECGCDLLEIREDPYSCTQHMIGGVFVQENRTVLSLGSQPEVRHRVSQGSARPVGGGQAPPVSHQWVSVKVIGWASLSLRQRALAMTLPSGLKAGAKLPSSLITRSGPCQRPSNSSRGGATILPTRPPPIGRR